MDLDLVFLGTSGSMPTAQRAPTAILLRRGGERLLFDCAEGTQRQLLRSNVGLVELREVFLTHYHADHYLGLPGMLKTFALRGRETPMTTYGPPGLSELYALVSLRVRPTQVAAVALNTGRFDEVGARAAIAATAEETGLPADDPVRFGPDRLLDAVLAALPSGITGR